MKVRSNFIWVVMCVVVLSYSCQNDEKENLTLDSSEFVWDEEFWQVLQRDADFTKIGELLENDYNVFSKLNDSVKSEIEIGKRLDFYIKTNTRINKAISTQLAILHEKYPQFAAAYYFELVKYTSVGVSLVESRNYNEWEVVGDCTYVRMYCGIIAQNMIGLYELYCNMCPTCQYNAFTPDVAILDGIRKTNLFTGSEYGVLVNNYHFLVFTIGRSSPSCESAGSLASQFYEKGATIRSVAEKMNQLKYFTQYPQVFFNIPFCQTHGGQGGSGGDSGEHGGGDGNTGGGNVPGTVISEELWWPPTHKRIINDALEGKGLTKAQLDSINLGSKLADREVKAQDTSKAYTHAMRKPNESIDECIVKMREYFVTEIEQYFESNDFIALGKALHMISDAYSPPHRFKVWKGNFWAYFPHIAEIGVVNQSGVDKSVVAVKWIYEEAVSKGRDLETVFNEWIDESNPIAPKRSKE